MANSLGKIGMSTSPGTGLYGGLGQVVVSGNLAGKYNAPVDYGTIIRFPGYYNVYFCIIYEGNVLYVSGDSGTGTTDNLVWHRVVIQTT